MIWVFLNSKKLIFLPELIIQVLLMETKLLFLAVSIPWFLTIVSSTTQPLTNGVNHWQLVVHPLQIDKNPPVFYTKIQLLSMEDIFVAQKLAYKLFTTIYIFWAHSLWLGVNPRLVWLMLLLDLRIVLQCIRIPC